MNRRHRGYWTIEHIDKAFDELKLNLGRNPYASEFHTMYGGALDRIITGKYSPGIDTWNKYLEHRGLNASRRSWTSERIDGVFNKMIQRLKRVPISDEFREENPGAFRIITEGRYLPQIRKWNQYLKSKGIQESKISWSLSKLDELFNLYERELGRKPSYTEFRARYPGAIIAINRRNIISGVTKWSQYVAYRENGNNIVDEREQVESLLEGYLDDIQ